MSCCAREAPRLRVWPLIASAAIAAQTTTLSLAINLSAASAATRDLIHGGLLAATLAVIALLGPSLFRQTARGLRERRLTIEPVFVTGIIGALAYSLWSMARGQGSVYFEVVCVLLVVHRFGTIVSDRTRQRALSQLALDDLTAEAAGLVVGDIYRAHPGRRIAADGVIVAGSAWVQEAAITGEFTAAAKRPGDSVRAGSVCVDSTLEIRVTHAVGDRLIDRLRSSVISALDNAAPLQRAVDRVARVFLPVVLVAAAATFALTFALVDFESALLRSLAVFLVACPCALGFATPIALWSATLRLNRVGLAVRDRATIETLAAVDTVVFDKTGTLTRPEAELVSFEVEAGFDDTEVRELVASVERESDHPIARCLRRLAPTDRFDVETTHVLPGRGIVANVVERANQTTTRVRIESGLADASVDVFVGDRRAATARFREAFRPSASPTIAALADLGIGSVAMTGDRAWRHGDLGLTRVETGMLPHEKRREVEALIEAGRRVLYVGDGINDAPAMAAAHVSLAVEGSADLAHSVASSVLTADLTTLPSAIEIARDAMAKVRRTLWYAAGYNAAGVALAAAGLLHPVFAALIMMASSVFVTLRAVSGERDEFGSAPAPMRARRPGFAG